MSKLSMSKQERETFLAALHVGVLAVDRPDGPPLMVPIWYRYTAEGVIEFNTESESEKARLLQQSGHASLCAQREELPYAYVTVEGPVEIDQTDARTRLDIASRYLGAQGGADYVAAAPHADDIVVRLRPTRWRTLDFSKLETTGG